MTSTGSLFIVDLEDLRDEFRGGKRRGGKGGKRLKTSSEVVWITVLLQEYLRADFVIEVKVRKERAKMGFRKVKGSKFPSES